MTSVIEVEFRVHRDVPGCCRGAITNYLALDRMQPYQELGDRISCGCGNSLVWDHRRTSRRMP